MKKSLFLIIPLVLLFVNPVEAQILRNIARSATNSVKNKAEDKVEEEVDNQVEKGVNKFFDDLTKKDTTATKKQGSTQEGTGTATGTSKSEAAANDGMSKFMKNLGVNTADVKHKDMYQFTSQIVTLNEATDENGKKTDPVESVMCINDKTSDVMIKMNANQNTSTTIMDTENTCMLILTESEGKKTGIASKFDPNAKGSTTAQQPNTQEQSDVADDCKLEKTGNTKTISGYSCKEYRCETADEISIAWVTKDISAANNKFFKGTATSANYKMDGLDGMVIRYEFKSKKDKSSSTMTITSIDMKKTSSFSTAGYQISSFSFGTK